MFYIILTVFLFFIGLFGVFITKKNILIILMSIELLLLGINLNFILFAEILDDIFGFVFGLFVLTVAAAEAAIGLAILINYYRLNGLVHLVNIAALKG